MIKTSIKDGDMAKIITDEYMQYEGEIRVFPNLFAIKDPNNDRMSVTVNQGKLFCQEYKLYVNGKRVYCRQLGKGDILAEPADGTAIGIT